MQEIICVSVLNFVFWVRLIDKKKIIIKIISKVWSDGSSRFEAESGKKKWLRRK